ncbi:MAG: PepSY domain-containing protein [Cyanobacteria bacterium J06621_15]
MKKQLLRKLHLTIAPIVILPLLITVSTGVIYRISKDWFGLSRNQVHFLMVLHEGEYFGKTLESVYVLLNGLGLLWMLVTGGAMLFQNFKNLNQANKSSESSALNNQVEISDKQ